MVEICSRAYIKILWTDRGGDFMSKEISSFCLEHDIQRELSAFYTPEQNGIVERKNQIVVEMVRSMIKTKGLSIKFWAEAVATSVIY